MHFNHFRSWSLCILFAFITTSPASAADAPPRERISFDEDWRFQKGDPEGVTNLNYAAIKDWVLPTANAFRKNAPAMRPAGNLGDDVAFAQPGFDDSAWRSLNLPHDWGVEGPFKQEYPGGSGKLAWWGVGWYRKHFTLPAADAGRQFYLDVDGAMAYASVWLNGQYIGGWPYGYASWRVDLTPYLKPGAENVLVIRVDNPPDSSRWYPGGGIYRNVWLVKTGPVHVQQWGTYITTPEVTKEAATVRISAYVENDSTAEADVSWTTSIYELDANGKKGKKSMGTAETAGVNIGAHGSAASTVDVTVAEPRLWSVKEPNRYVAVTTVEQDGRVVDQYETPFGIRTIQFTADNGFLLNGERVPLNGVCDHHDLGALGSAINTRALERQLEILKDMGCNAIRTSHNPPAPELLDLCDRMGFLVMDEMFDCWEVPKMRNDYHRLFDDWHEADARMLIRRDRDHPCVVLWSIGNEVPEQTRKSGTKIAAELAGIVHGEDPTRPVTSACNEVRAGFNGFATNLDVFGYNYRPDWYGRFRATNSLIPLFGSETASCVSSRGEYFFPVYNDKSAGKADFQVSSYDLYAPPWANPPDVEFRGLDQNPFVCGEFIWTGFDYLGEPTPWGADTSGMPAFTDSRLKEQAAEQLAKYHRVLSPARSSYFGIIDLAGFKKDRFYLYQAYWRPDFPMAHILPHWNWPDRLGQVTPVHVYTSGDEAELFLNGQSLGRKKKGPLEYRLRWDDVTYEPGTLKVVAYKNGKKWATDSVSTTGPAARLELQPDRTRIKADGKDLSYVTVTVADKEGLMVPRADNLIHFAIEGPGEIVGVDNGDATSHEPFQAQQHSAFNGLALVIVRSTKQSGTIHLRAKSDELESAVVVIKSVEPGNQ